MTIARYSQPWRVAMRVMSEAVDRKEATDKIIKLLAEIASTHPKCLSRSAPEFFVGEIRDHHVEVYCRPWCKSEDHWPIHWDLVGRIQAAFDREGVGHPQSYHGVYMRKASNSFLQGNGIDQGDQ
jgi:small conductance mechanosensitive channel